MSAEDDKRQAEMLDRYRNSGTLNNILMIDRENLERLIEDRVNKRMIELRTKKRSKLRSVCNCCDITIRYIKLIYHKLRFFFRKKH